MKVLRHEEFTETCAAACNGPYDNRWSKTMFGYGSEHTHFTMELTYNYGVKSYELGNEFHGVTIKSKDIIERAIKLNYPVVKEADSHVLIAPDGFKFFILNEPQPTDQDPIVKITYNVTDLAKAIRFWHEILTMSLLGQTEKTALVSYTQYALKLELREIAEPLDRAKAYGRIAFAVPYDTQPAIDEHIQKHKQTILTPLVSLDTPGKATVRVIILADPNGHEICFVDDEGFTQLSEFDPEAEKQLERYMEKDPFK